MKKNSKNTAKAEAPVITETKVETPVTKETVENKTTENKATKTPKNKKVGVVSTEATKVADNRREIWDKTAVHVPCKNVKMSSVDKAHLTEEQLKEEALIKEAIANKQKRYAIRMAKYLANAKKREEGKRIALQKLSINNTIPNGDKKAHPDVPANAYDYKKELEKRRGIEKEAKLKAKEKAEKAGTLTRKQQKFVAEEKRLKSGKTVTQRLEMLAERRTNRAMRNIENSMKMTQLGKQNLARFIESQTKRNEKRGYVAKHAFHTAAQKEAIKAQVVARKAAKAAKPLQFKVEGENTNEYMANCTFVRPDGTKFLQKKYWYASNKEGADPKVTLKAKVQKIFDALESKNKKRSIVFESIHVYPNFGKDMGECVTNMIASKKHVTAQLGATATEMSAAA